MEKNKAQLKLAPKWNYRKRSVRNLLRMGHCAPTVMQTLLDISATQKEWPVRLSAGMPGGIGNTGFECGALTSPLVMIGLRHGLHDMQDGLPVIFEQGHALCRHFVQCHKTLLCRQIRGKDRFPRHCIPPVCQAPELWMAARDQQRETLPAQTREAYRRLYSHLSENGFHCARAVFDHLQYREPGRQELQDAASAFLGGTLFLGLTCSALAAAVMAVGLQSGEIENSPLKVMRLIFRMTTGGDAFDENLNKFNRSMNTGCRMSKWFTREFGSTQCRAITGCDFSTQAGVDHYIGSGGVTRCREIALKVAELVRTGQAIS